MADNPLGQQVGFPEQYDPGVLAVIPRAECREATFGETVPPFYGADLWTAYELSWLNPRGKPQVAIGRFVVPCDSPNLIESKSLKLYLGSLNQERYESRQALSRIIAADLGRAVGSRIKVSIHSVTELQHTLPEAPAGLCLDELDLSIDTYEPDAELLAMDPGGELVEEVVYTQLFRSLCPVTGQPDWATVTVCYRGKQISHAALLQYLVSYRRHQDYHENCVERIYRDIRSECRPRALRVEANFLRRGGIDINPVRSSTEVNDYHQFPRYLRQ